MNYFDVRSEISENLKYYMGVNGLSLSELSKESRVPKSSLSRYLKGLRIPSFVQMVNLACVLGVTVDDLFSTDEIINEEGVKNWR